MKMKGFLDTTGLQACKSLEDNFDLILEEYNSFSFNIDKVDDLGDDTNWELWQRVQKATYRISNTEYEKGYSEYTTPYETYQQGHGWYGLKSREGKSVWDGVLLATKANADNAVSSGLNPTPVCNDFFNKTIDCLQGFPEVMNVMLARLPSGGSLPKHRGFKALVRVHFGLVVPDGDINFWVDGDEKKWEPGKCLAFNDGSEHTAWNKTDIDRIILIMDLWGESVNEHK